MTSTPEVLVRRATPDDRERVLDTVVAAFTTDPAWAYITGGDTDRVAPLFAGALFDGRVRDGTVWVADDCRAVAMWSDRTGGPVDEDHAGRVWSDYRRAVGEDAWANLQRYDRAIEEYAPPRPYWYLGVLATHPSVQGTGLASAVLRPVLAAAGRAGLDCWLETSVPANTEFYERRGFTERVRVDVEGLPTTWWMRHPPGG